MSHKLTTAPKPAAAPKKSTSASSHGSYQDMIKIAILNLKERNGSSRQAIKKYVQSNNNLGSITDGAFSSHINRAITAGEKNGIFDRPKGPSGPVKLKKPAVDAAKPTAAKAAAPKKDKLSEEKKTTAPKTKKTITSAPAKKSKSVAASTKKTPAHPTANTSKKADKAASSSAEETEPEAVTSHTKSGRVTKSNAPAAAAAKKKTSSSTTKKVTARKVSSPASKKSAAASKKE